MFLFVGKIIAERAQRAQRSPIILQNSSNPSNWKNLDIRPYDRTTVRPTAQGATFTTGTILAITYWKGVEEGNAQAPLRA